MSSARSKIAVLLFLALLGDRTEAQLRAVNPLLPAVFRLDVKGGEEDQSCTAFVIHVDGPTGNRTLYFLTAAHCFFPKGNIPPKNATVFYGGRDLPVDLRSLRYIPIPVGLPADTLYLEDVALFWITATGFEVQGLPLSKRGDRDEDFQAVGYSSGSNQSRVLRGDFAESGTGPTGTFIVSSDFQYGMSGGPVISGGRVLGLIKGFESADFGPGNSLRQVVPIERAEVLFPYVNHFAGFASIPFQPEDLQVTGKVSLVSTVEREVIEPFTRRSQSINVGCEQTNAVDVPFDLPANAKIVGQPSVQWVDVNNLDRTQVAASVAGGRVIGRGSITGLAYQTFGFIRNCPGGGHATLEVSGTYAMVSSRQERSTADVSQKLPPLNSPETASIKLGNPSFEAFQFQIRSTGSGEVLDSFAVTNPDLSRLPATFPSARGLFSATLVFPNEIRIARAADFNERFTELRNIQAVEANRHSVFEQQVLQYQKTLAGQK